MEHGRAALLDQWDDKRNAPRTPRDVSYGSHQKVWWRCAVGHTWQAEVYSRSAGSGCPYCAGRRAVSGNTLAECASALVDEWDAEKNAPLTPADVTVGSHRLIWWRCKNGHSYRSAAKTRIQGSGCPYCAGRAVLPEENSLAARYPALTAEWDVEKNAPLTPEQVLAGTRRKVWWRCAKGHSWQAAVLSRTQMGTGCPVCAGHRVLAGDNDFASQYPRLAAEWDSEMDGALSPEAITSNSNRKVWWRCDKGHSYASPVAGRTRNGNGCPYCANRRVLPGFNDLATLYPGVAAEWHPTLNGMLRPENVVAGSHRKIWWQCSLGHVWKAAVYSRTGNRMCGCPVCAGKTRYSNRGEPRNI